jgi:hypothetical protein
VINDSNSSNGDRVGDDEIKRGRAKGEEKDLSLLNLFSGNNRQAKKAKRGGDNV